MADWPNQDRKLGLTSLTVKGRKYTKYDPNIALDIVERIAEGELLRDICSPSAKKPTVAKSTFLRWVATVPELSKAYAAAQRISALSLEEEALHAAKKVRDNPGSAQNVSAANTYISQLRWSASRRDPTHYSDKGNLNIVVPINISTPLDLGTGGSKIDTEIPDMYDIKLEAVDAEYEEIKEEPKEELTTSDLKNMIDLSPVTGTERQPIYQRPKQDMAAIARGPRKRVLTPRNPDYEKKK